MLVGALIGLAVAVSDLVSARGGAFAAGTEAAALALLALFFAYLGRRAGGNQPLTTGVLLLVIAVIARATLGPGMDVVARLGAILVFLAGVLYLIEPVTTCVRTGLAA